MSRIPKGLLRWEDPPIHGNAGPKRPLKYQDAADALSRVPGRWAVVVEDIPVGSASNLAHRIRTGVAPWLPVGAYESKAVGPAGGKGKVYARYIGEES